MELNALGRGMDISRRAATRWNRSRAAVTVGEDDPNDDSVGYGDCEEEGEVELDASVTHGPTAAPVRWLPWAHPRMVAAREKREERTIT